MSEGIYGEPLRCADGHIQTAENEDGERTSLYPFNGYDDGDPEMGGEIDHRFAICVNAMNGVNDPFALIEEHREMREALSNALRIGGFSAQGWLFAGRILDRIKAREEAEKA